MILLKRMPEGKAPAHPLGTLAEDREPRPLRLRRVIERDLDARLQHVFAAFEGEPFATSSLSVRSTARAPETASTSRRRFRDLRSATQAPASCAISGW